MGIEATRSLMIGLGGLAVLSWIGCATGVGAGDDDGKQQVSPAPTTQPGPDTKEPCAADLAACAGSCVDLGTDPHHCGGCNITCGLGLACEAGLCAVDGGCDGDRVDCGNGCVDLAFSAQHCGACGNACGPGLVCADGVCAMDCPGTLVDCGEYCANLNTDVTHCGACGTGCDATQTCDAGACVCAPGLIACAAACVNPATDVNNCGGCNNVCAPTESCNAGICGVAVPIGQSTLLTGASNHLAHYLLGNLITVNNTATITSFGVWSIQNGPNVRMALYSDVAGEPGALIAETTSTPLTIGAVEIPVLATAVLTPGDYWVMAVYDGLASVGIDLTDPTATAKYVALSYGSPLPDPFSNPLPSNAQLYNYYIKVVE